MLCINNIKEQLKTDEIDGFLITNEINVRYVTGFTGSESFLLITKGQDYLFTDFRYIEQAQQDVPWIQVLERGASMIKAICGKMKRLKFKKFYVESSSLTLKQYNEIKKNIGTTKIIPSQGIVESYRKRKTADEIEKIQGAIDIAEKAYIGLKKKIKPNISEKKLADMLEFELRKHGAEKSSFEIICAAGSHASQPHARASNMKIQRKVAILFDWGAHAQFYNSDLTRVCFRDRISTQFKRIYQIVLDAQYFAIDKIKPGIKAKDVDFAARSFIEKKGFGKFFGHGLGHGIGMEVHEGPYINKRNKELLQEGMVFTIEPGIYLPGWGGVRLEDMVLVSRTGCEVLSSLPKKLTEIAI